jgi:hypothetical protein
MTPVVNLFAQTCDMRDGEQIARDFLGDLESSSDAHETYARLSRRFKTEMSEKDFTRLVSDLRRDLTRQTAAGGIPERELLRKPDPHETTRAMFEFQTVTGHGKAAQRVALECEGGTWKVAAFRYFPY